MNANKTAFTFTAEMAGSLTQGCKLNRNVENFWKGFGEWLHSEGCTVEMLSKEGKSKEDNKDLHKRIDNAILDSWAEQDEKGNVTNPIKDLKGKDSKTLSKFQQMTIRAANMEMSSLFNKVRNAVAQAKLNDEKVTNGGRRQRSKDEQISDGIRDIQKKVKAHESASYDQKSVLADLQSAWNKVNGKGIVSK